MNVSHILETLNDLLTVAALFIGGFIALRIYLHFSPGVKLRIIPRVSGSQATKDNEKILVVRLEVENYSKVRIFSPKIRVQVLESDINSPITDYIPFKNEEDRIKNYRSWREPKNVFQSTETIDPGEILSSEIKYLIPVKTLVHIGLQCEINPNWLERKIINQPKKIWTIAYIEVV